MSNPADAESRPGLEALLGTTATHDGQLGRQGPALFKTVAASKGAGWVRFLPPPLTAKTHPQSHHWHHTERRRRTEPDRAYLRGAREKFAPPGALIRSHRRAV